MATAGSIVVDLLARTGSFETDMDRAARKLKGVGQEVDTLSRNINRLMVASGAALAAFAGSSAALAMQMAKGMDATAKMAEQIGTTTEALTGLRFAAQQYANVSDQTFDMAMRRMTRRIEEAANGAGGAKNALEALGLSAQQLSRLSPDKQFLALADALKNTDSQAARLRHTMAIFDTEGMPLVAALQRGSAEMERGIETARRYGLVLSQDAAQAAQQFVSNMDALSFASRGFQQALTEAVLPYLVEATNKLVEFSEKAGPAAERVEQAFKIAGVGAGALALVLGGRLVVSATAVSASFVRATYDTVRYEYALARMADQTRIASAGFATLAATSRGWSIISGILGGPGGVVATIGLAAAGFVAMAAASRDAGEGLEEFAGSAEDATRKFRELGVLQREATIDKLGDRLSEQAREASKAWSDFVNEIEPTTARGARAVAQMRAEMRDELRAITQNTELSSRDMQQAVSDLIDKWVENGQITAAQAAAYRSAAASATELQAKAHDTSKRIAELSAEAARLEAELRGAAGGAQALNEALSQTNEAGQKFLERLADQAITAGLKTQREQLEALVKAGKLVFSPDDLEKARKHADHIDRMNAAYKGASSAAKEFESSVKSLIAAHLPEIKATEDLHKNLATLQAAQKAGIVVGQNYTRALESINKAYAEQVKSWLPESIKKVQEQVKAAQEQQKQLQQQIRTFGLAESAVTALAIADTDAAIAKLEAAKASEVANGATAERVKEIQAEIQALQKLKELQTGIAADQQRIEWLQQQQQAWDDWSRQVDQIFQHVGQSLTDAIFEGGKSGKELLKDIFKSLTFNVLINPVMGAMQGWVTNQLGGMFGYQNPQQQGGGGILGMAQNASSLHSAFTGGFTDTMAGGINWLGEQFGSSALKSFAAGMTGTAAVASTSLGAATMVPGLGVGVAGGAAATGGVISGTAGLIPGLGVGAGGGAAAAGGVASGAAASGAAGAGAAFAAAAPWVLGGLAVASLLSGSFEGEDRFGNTYTYQDGKTTPGSWAGDPGTELNNAGSQMVQAAVDAINAAFAGVGSSAFVSKFYGEMETSEKDRGGVNSGGYLSGIPGLGATPEQAAARLAGEEQRRPYWHQITPEGGEFFGTLMRGDGHGPDSGTLEEMAQYLQTDLMQTVIQAWQLGIDEFPAIVQDMIRGIDADSLSLEQASAVVQQVQAIIGQVQAFQAAVESLPFANLRDLSFDAAAGLIQLSGGLDGLMGGLNTYYENFYSEAERYEAAVGNVSKALADAGVVMPQMAGSADDMKSAYRALVEAQDLNTEAGRQAYAVLIQSSGAFAELATYAGQAALDMERAAEDQRRAAEQARQQALSDLSTAYNAVVQAGQREIARLQESFGATDTAMNAYRSAVQRLESEFNSLFSAIDRGVQALRGTGAAFDAQYHQARAVISTALVTGQLPQTADLTEALRVAQHGVTAGVYASRFEQEKAYAILANEMEALRGIAEPELDTARAMLEQLESQYRLLRGIGEVGSDSLAALEQQVRLALAAEESARQQISIVEQQLEATREQYEALTGIKSSIDGGFSSLAEALASFAAAAAAASRPAAGGGGGSSGGSTSPDDAYYAAKLAQLQATGSMHDGINWSHANVDDLKTYFGTIGLTPEEHWEKWGRHEGLKVPGFAGGGSHLGGWRIVGENGPELEATGPARIYNAGQTADILRNLQGNHRGDQETQALLRQIVDRLERLERPMASTARATGQLADQTDRVSAGGNATATEIMNVEELAQAIVEAMAT